MTSKPIKKKKTSDRSKLIRRYDALLSKYLRLKAQAEHNLYCFTCGKKLTYDTAVAMHFIGRRYVSVRFDMDNVHVGCRECNAINRDQPAVLARYAELLGEETVARLNQKKKQRVTTEELEEQYNNLLLSYNSLPSYPVNP